MTSTIRQSFIVSLVACGLIGAIIIFEETIGCSLLLKNRLISENLFTNTGLAGGFVSLCLVADVGLLLSVRKSSVAKMILWVIVAIFCTAIVLSDSRTAWLAALSGVTFLIYRNIRVSGHPHVRLQSKICNCRWNHIMVMVALTLVIASLAIGLYFYRPSSVKGRLLIWRVCLDMILDKPMFGYGPNGVVRNYMLYQADFFDHHPFSSFVMYADNNVYAFNEVLHLLIDWGIVGTMAIIYLVVSRLSVESSSFDNTIIKAVLVSWSIFAMFSYPFSQAPFFIIFWMCCLVLEDRSTMLYRTFVNGIFLLVLFIGTVWFILGRSLDGKIDRLFDSYGQYSDNEVLFQQDSWMMNCFPLIQGRYVAFCEMYSNAFPMVKDSTATLRETTILNSTKVLPLFGVYCAAGDILDRRFRYDDAIAFYEKSSSMIPLRLYPRYKIFLIMLKRGNYEDARRIGTEILSMPIKIRSSEAIRILTDVEHRCREL